MRAFACVIASVGIVAASTALVAQTPPLVGGKPEWKRTPTAIVHTSGLKCPSAVWKGYDTEAPEYFRSNDDLYGIKIDAICQYTAFGMEYLRTFTVNIYRVADIGAFAQADYNNAQILAKRRNVPLTQSAGKIVRHGTSYRVISYAYEPHHRSMLISRDKDGEKVIVSAYVPNATPDEKVWTVVEPLLAANP